MVEKNDDRLRAREAAAYLDVSRSTLTKWRTNGSGPPFHRCGPRLVYYLKSEIDSWLASCDDPTSRPAP